MTRYWRFRNWLSKTWDYRVVMPRYRIKRWFRRFGKPAPLPDPAFMEALQQLTAALSAGNYSGTLEKGSVLKVESLEATMKCVTFEGPRAWPKWWQIHKLWSKKYMRELIEQRKRTSLQFRR